MKMMLSRVILRIIQKSLKQFSFIGADKAEYMYNGVLCFDSLVAT
jgi:hypothetical protein